MTKKRTNISHAQFFAITEELRKAREPIESGCKTTADVIALLRSRGTLTFSFADGPVELAIKLLGIKLPRKNKTPYGKYTASRDQIVEAVVALYHKLGETPPTSLTQILSDRNGQA